MAKVKVNVTKELAEKIKELRLINRVKAIDVADHVEKSSAYISKLENGDIKTMDYEELLKIFNFISKNKDDLGKFIDKLSLEYDSKALDDQTWFLNFDTVERNIPVPNDLVDYINNKISDLGFNITYVVDYINKNEDIKDIVEKNNLDISKYKNNLWYAYEFADKVTTAFIVIKLDTTTVTNILEKKNDISNYITIQSLLYNLLRLEHELKGPLSDEDNSKIKNEVVSILNSYKFYSSKEKSILLDTAVTTQELDSLLNEFDIENRKLVNKLLSQISFLSDWNVKYTNEKMISLNKNFNWDASFALAISSLPYFELNNISKSMRSNFLSDINGLIDEYKNMPESEKTIETY